MYNLIIGLGGDLMGRKDINALFLKNKIGKYNRQRPLGKLVSRCLKIILRYLWII